MCNRYQNKAMAAEVADHFRVQPVNVASFNVPAEIYPKYPGMVVRAEGGVRHLEAMTWGFPRHAVSKKTGKPLKPTPVNNARDDRLLQQGWPWKESFERRRCLIPLTAWAEAEGPAGAMTCTWYSLPDAEVFAVGGIWRPSDEWGNVYSMVMVDGCAQMSQVHDRMPVILRPDRYDQWMDGSVDDALQLVRTCGDPLAVDRTRDLWSQRDSTPTLL